MEQNLRIDCYNDLISMGMSPSEAWELINQMDFADDYEC